MLRRLRFSKDGTILSKYVVIHTTSISITSFICGKMAYYIYYNYSKFNQRITVTEVTYYSHQNYPSICYTTNDATLEMYLDCFHTNHLEELAWVAMVVDK